MTPKYTQQHGQKQGVCVCVGAGVQWLLTASRKG